MSKMKGRIFMRKSGLNAGKCLRIISEPFKGPCKDQNKLLVKIQWIGSTVKWNFPLSLFVNSERFQEVVPTVTPLRKQDLKNVTLMDNESGFHVSQQVRDLCDNEFNDYSWGLYLGGVLIGYCTIGYADDVPETIENHPAYVDDCYLLSDVYVCPSYRNLGYGLKMIKEVIENRWSSEEKLPVFLECFDDRVQSFYRKAGFSRVEDKTDLSCMVLEP